MRINQRRKSEVCGANSRLCNLCKIPCQSESVTTKPNIRIIFCGYDPVDLTTVTIRWEYNSLRCRISNHQAILFTLSKRKRVTTICFTHANMDSPIVFSRKRVSRDWVFMSALKVH